MADRTDEEQIEALKAWWQENGRALILGVVLGAVAIGGWRVWDGYQENRALEASAIYEELQTALRDKQTKAVSEHARRLLDDYGGTSYASFAALALAQQAVQQDDLESAENLLRRALAESGDPAIQHVARLRLIQLLVARDQFDDALKHIDAADPGPFLARYEELRGDILQAQGKTGAARKSYRLALANTPPEAELHEYLSRKLEALGPDREPSPETPE